MDDRTYSITLADGTVISNLKLSGNNFISEEEVTEDIFTDNCSPVTISDGETEDVHENMEFVQVIVNAAGLYYFVLRDISAYELELAEIKANQEYIAMMAGVEL